MPLKKSDLARYKKRLEEMKAQYAHLVRYLSDEVKTPEESANAYSQHQAEAATDDSTRSISLQVSDEELKVLRQIERALEKIEDGTYGKCDISGEEIPTARLEAIPYANMSVKSQEMWEKGLIQ
jgi:DnaK suppressor protein